MARRAARRCVVGTVLLIAVAAGLAPPADRDAAEGEEDDGSFGLSAPVACSEVRGFEDYDALPNAAISADEKLSIYFRPRHYKWSHQGDRYRVHFAEESQIRRHGEKSPVLAKFKTMEFKEMYKVVPENIYLSNKISLKGLKPGEYDYEIVLSDEIGKSAPATRVLRFRVVAPTEAPAETKEDAPGAP
jgi:hypothetical protein